MRLISLDVLRGATIFGMILVNSAAGLHYGVEAAVFPTLLHASWDGLTLADLVFPGFLMMVGVAIPFSLKARPVATAQIGHVSGRTLRLVVLGLALSNLYWFRDMSAGDWRLFGVLQRIGVVYGVCAMLFLACSPRVRAAMIAALLLLYWPLMLLPGLDGLPADLWLKGHNFAASVDRVLSAPHIYVQGPAGYDPEGWLGTLPAIAHGLIGIAVGERLQRNDGRATRVLLGWGAAMLVVGFGWSWFFPVIKDIWSSSFVLATCGITTIALALLHGWLDRPDADAPERRAVVTVAGAFGINAIAAYALHMVTAEMPTWDLLLVPFHATREAIGDGLASLLPIGLYLLFIWLCLEGLRRKGWIIKI